MKRLSLFLLAFIQTAALWAAEQFVSFSPLPGALSLASATICYSAADDEGVKIALGNLQADMERVVGHAPQLTTTMPVAFGAGQHDGRGVQEAAVILVGTVGRSPAIDALHLEGLKGCREKFIIVSADRLASTTARALPRNTVVIAGSDRRGTIYGIYELSRQMGVSPWYWWADVPVVHRDSLFFVPGSYTDGEPAVEFRGLFLNDEAPCLTSWVKHTWGTDYGDHRFYAKVFELILRLKGNMLWPAMWQWAFYADDPENGRTADRMGVIMGTSHHEPMARNHQEYARRRKQWGPWNYQTNQASLDRFFREGIERMKGTEDIVTIGMRGDGDEAMSDTPDTKLMERIVANQRKIIRQVTGKAPEKTTQVWALYKEVQDYYDAGFRVPDDVIMLVSDDNWGDIRRVPVTEEEKRHKGGWGIYYHVDYVGAPRNSKWLNVTQTQQMFEQLSLAYDFGLQRLWILNVGDLKPMEYPIQLFMDMAWNPKAYTLQTVTDHTRRFFESVLAAPALGTGAAAAVPDAVPAATVPGAAPAATVPGGFAAGAGSIASEAAAIFNENCRFMARVTPEMLDARTYSVETGEWRRVADDYQRLELRALRLYEQIPVEARDSYRQLLLFPVQAMANLYDMYYAQAMNQHLARRNSPEANVWADRVERCFRRDSLLCAAYNTDIAGGKWRGMMTQKHIGYTSWNDNFPHDKQPATVRVGETANGGSHPGGYTFAFTPTASAAPVSSSSSPVSSSSVSSSSAAPASSSPVSSASSSAPVSSASSSAPVSYAATVLQPRGYVAMEAEHFYEAAAPEGTQWSVYPHYGRTRSAVALTPYTAPVGDARLDYRFTLPEGVDTVKVHVVVKSTLDFLNVGGHEYSVAIDGGDAQTVNFNKTLIDRQPYMYSEFYPTIARRVVEKVVELPVGQADGDGCHRLTLQPRHGGIVFEKVVVDFGGYRPSYLFMDESDHSRR